MTQHTQDAPSYYSSCSAAFCSTRPRPTVLSVCCVPRSFLPRKYRHTPHIFPSSLDLVRNEQVHLRNSKLAVKELKLPADAVEEVAAAAEKVAAAAADVAAKVGGPNGLSSFELFSREPGSIFHFYLDQVLVAGLFEIRTHAVFFAFRRPS